MILHFDVQGVNFITLTKFFRYFFFRFDLLTSTNCLKKYLKKLELQRNRKNKRTLWINMVLRYHKISCVTPL